jgi:hypothetical protein
MNFEPLAPGEDSHWRRQHDWRKPDEERVERTAVAGYAAICRALISRIADPAMVMVSLAGIGVVVGSMINGMVLGGGGYVGPGVSIL